MEELVFERQAAAEYDRAFAHVARYFMPFVLRAARIARGMRVLDIAAGTGLSAEAALSAVGPTGHVTAADVSPAMVERSRERLGEARNASVLVEDAQALRQVTVRRGAGSRGRLAEALRRARAN